jgi:SAM-dependent methyltransferase
MYLSTKFHFINEALYVYRVHGDNAWLRWNKEIQEGVYPLYFKYIDKMVLKWSSNNGLLSLDLGGRLNCPDGYKSVDLKNADIVVDLNERWPFPDNSVGVVRAFDVLEHLKDPLHTMKELYRVLTPGGYAFIQVPSTDGRGAFQDPTHVSFWNENSFLYYTNRDFAAYIDTPVRFQAIRLFTTEKNDRGVCWVTVHLLKLTDGVRVPGEVVI